MNQSARDLSSYLHKPQADAGQFAPGNMHILKGHRPPTQIRDQQAYEESVLISGSRYALGTYQSNAYGRTGRNSHDHHPAEHSQYEAERYFKRAHNIA